MLRQQQDIHLLTPIMGQNMFAHGCRLQDMDEMVCEDTKCKGVAGSALSLG